MKTYFIGGKFEPKLYLSSKAIPKNKLGVIAHCLLPKSNYEEIVKNIEKIASVVGHCEIEVFDGKMKVVTFEIKGYTISNVIYFALDLRKKYEAAYDSWWEYKHYKRTIRTGRRSGDMTSWIKKGPLPISQEKKKK